jgi:CubicO group peptidase (beta-lactamase class C family)
VNSVLSRGLALRRTAQYLREQTEQKYPTMLMTGAQVCVIDERGRECSLAFGHAGVSVHADTMFRVYCSIKPITAIAIAKLVDADVVALDEPLGCILSEVRALRTSNITLRDVLTHRAGLREPSGVQMEMLPPARRAQILFDETEMPADWNSDHQTAYSEALGWAVLGRLIETLTHETLADHLRSSVLDPLGLHDTWIGMPREHYQSNAYRVGLNYDFRHPPKVFPVLMENLERVCCEVNCAYGGYSTATDLARFYARLLVQLRSGSQPCLPAAETLHDFCTATPESRYDVVLQRTCAFGLGFMRQLNTHHFGTYCSELAFGHSGWSGSSFGLADPATGLAIAAITNGLLPDAAAHLSRLNLLRAIHDDYKISTTTTT